MPKKRRDKSRYTSTCVELKDMSVIKQYLAFRGITLIDYLNELIERDVIDWPEFLSIQYFKGVNQSLTPFQKRRDKKSG